MSIPKTNTLPATLDGLPKNSEEMLVQKSLPLLALWRSEFTLPELKILDSYLARINSHNSEAHTVVFQKGELESILKISRINLKDLKARMTHLMTPVILQSGHEFRQVVLFDESYCTQDDDGLWQVTLTCSNAAMKYFFNLENIGYLRYRLRTVTSLGSRYSYILFLYLEANRFRGTWEISLDDLRHILRCEDDSTYESYKRFNDRLLKRCYNELQEKTELRFSYMPVRTGRSVTGVRFKVEKFPKLDDWSLDGPDFDAFDPAVNPDLSQISAKDSQTAEAILATAKSKGFVFRSVIHEQPVWESTMDELLGEPWISDDNFGMGNDRIEDYDLLFTDYTPEQRQQLYNALCEVPKSKFYHFAGIRECRKRYLCDKLEALSKRQDKETVHNPFGYLLKMIENDANE